MEPVTHCPEFTLSALALVAAVVGKMIKIWVTMGNISHVSLNLTKRLILVMFKDVSSFSKFTFIFSLYFTNYGCFSP